MIWYLQLVYTRLPQVHTPEMREKGHASTNISKYTDSTRKQENSFKSRTLVTALQQCVIKQSNGPYHGTYGVYGPLHLSQIETRCDPFERVLQESAVCTAQSVNP